MDDLTMFWIIESICVVGLICVLILHIREKKHKDTRQPYSAIGNWIHGGRWK